MSTGTQNISFLPYQFYFITFSILAVLLGSFVSFILVILIVISLKYYAIPVVDRLTSANVFNLENPTAVAHRGCALDSPENTITAFQKVSYACILYL